MKLLPTGSYLQLTRSINIPGMGAQNKLTANGVKSATRGCMQYIARDTNSYWVFLPVGPHAGWKEVPFNIVEYCDCPAPQELLDLVAERENSKPMMLSLHSDVTAAAMGAEPKPQKRSKTPQA